ncbi:hypothetical protein LguiA_031857 [Lonicera macranthoides]
MSAIFATTFTTPIFTSPPKIISTFCTSSPLISTKLNLHPHSPLSSSSSRPKTLVFSKSNGESELSVEDEWLKKLPDKKKPLYAHSVPCIEAWLRNLGFYQSKDDVAVWFVEKIDWHAQLSLDVTDLCIRYLKSGPGNLGKDVERRFSYALSREDIENAILGGP